VKHRTIARTLVILAAAWALAIPAFGGEGAAGVVKASGARPGLCVLLGATDGKICAELGEGGRYAVHGLAADAAAAEKARGHIRSKNLYGKVAVGVGSFSRLPYASDLANLLIADGVKGLAIEEAARVIAPYGVAMLRGPSAADVRKKLAGLKNVAVTEAGGWVKIAKMPPAGTDEWRQWKHDAGRSRTSRDMLVGPPRQIRWMDGPRRARDHYQGPQAVVSANGRNFIIHDDATPLVAVPNRWVLLCRDAYNGLELWERPLPEMSGYIPPTLTAVGDRVYYIEKRGGPIQELDAASGKKLREIKHHPKTISYLNGSMLLSGGGPVRLLDVKTGEIKWTSKIEELYGHGAPLVAGDRIYLQTGRKECDAVVCLDLASGAEKWRVSRESLKRAYLVTVRDGVMVFSSHKADPLQVLSAEDGKFLWSHKYPSPGHGGSPSNTFVLGGMVWVNDNGERRTETPRPRAWLGFDAKTGEKKKVIKVQLVQKCFRDSATEKYILSGTMNFIDWKNEKQLRNRAVRAACRFGYFVANGMVYTFPTDCKCMPWLRGQLGLVPAAPGGKPFEPQREGRLVTGPAAGAAPGPAAGAEDWPIYRGNAKRSGAAGTEVPPGVTELWATELGGKLTPPTIAAGKVFVASSRRHEVYALDAASGKRLWSFSTGGRVDGAPTYHRGLVVFGCRDGRVYCLRAADGKLAWRFQAAPAEERMMVYGQLESPWPVHGSVLAEDGKVYFAAGRHSDLDGGITLFALDAGSGKVVWEKAPKYFTYSDILLRSGKGLAMSQLRVDPATGETAPSRYGHYGAMFANKYKINFRGLPDQKQPIFNASSSSTFDEDTYAFRTRWIFSPILAAQMIVFDEERFICMRALPGIKGLQKRSVSRPGKGDHSIWMSPRETEVKPQENKSWLKQFSEPKGWDVTVNVRPRGMLLSGDNAFIVGKEDAHPAKKIEMICLSAADGKELSRLRVESPPVFDGLAAASSRLYLSTQDGKLRCFGKK
jgi:outer membrane protein assembly factor BamB